MKLCVNVDHVATVRQARLGSDPDPVMAATLAILGGADGITIHLRDDRRHINDRDLDMLKKVVPVELNLEMGATDEMIRIALHALPDLVTLVPEKRLELTTEGGLNLHASRNKLRKAIRMLQGKGIKTSLFINPSPDDVDISKEIGADMIEVHTGCYANAQGDLQERELVQVMKAVHRAVSLGLDANAGHGLNYYNVSRIAESDSIRGLYIGHSIISRAVLIGMERAVREMRDLLKRS
jgi:pyridoxine 5-phosphate synthase